MENQETLRLRLRELRKLKPKLTQAEAAAAVGVSDRMWFAFEKGLATPRIDVLEKFAINRGISLHELLSSSKGEPHEVPWEIDVPIIDRIPAGPLTQGFGDGGILGYLRSSIKDPDAFALVVTGISMWPEIDEGDMVICSPRASFLNGKIYAVVSKESEQSLKRVRHDTRAKAYALIPTNKEFPTVYIPEEQVIKLVRVVESRRDYQ